MNHPDDDRFEEEVVEEVPSEDIAYVNDGGQVEEEFEYIDPSELKQGAPWWVVALVGLLAAAVGAGAMLLSGYSREDLLSGDAEDAAPISTTICSGTANVRSTGSLNGDVVDTLSFGDAVTGMLAGGWVKLGEGRYVSVSVLCDLAPVTEASSTTESSSTTETTESTTEASSTTETTESTTEGSTATQAPATPERVTGTFEASGEGPQTVELPEDVRGGIITFEHTGPGEFTLSGADGEVATSTPALSVTGDYAGTTVFGVADDVPSLVVDAAGQWVLYIAPLDTAPEMVDGVGSTSTAAYRLGDDPGTWRFNPTAPATLVQYGLDGTTASAEVTGPSEVELMGGGTYLVVYTGGQWTADEVTAGDDAGSTDAP